MPRSTGSITLIAVGKLRANHYKLAQDEYLKRLKRYTNFKLIQVKDIAGSSIPDVVAKQREGQALLAAAANTSRTFAFTPTGKLMDSRQFASFVQKQIDVYQKLAFLIGGPLGFSPEALASCDGQLSLSPLTFPHELARVVVLEQLYRAFTIINRENYHK